MEAQLVQQRLALQQKRMLESGQGSKLPNKVTLSSNPKNSKISNVTTTTSSTSATVTKVNFFWDKCELGYAGCSIHLAPAPNYLSLTCACASLTVVSLSCEIYCACILFTKVGKMLSSMTFVPTFFSPFVTLIKLCKFFLLFQYS